MSVYMPTEMQLIPAIPRSNPSQNSELLGVSTSKCWWPPPWHCDWWIRYWLFVNYRKPFSDPQWQLQSLGLSLPDRDGAYKSLRWAPERVGSRQSGTLPLHRCFWNLLVAVTWLFGHGLNACPYAALITQITPLQLGSNQQSCVTIWWFQMWMRFKAMAWMPV